ncbi:MAG: glycosyltransferase family 4 protein, partial [Phycisphaeraceae bacterium]
GGLERHFVDLCTALSGRGIEVIAVADQAFADRLPQTVRHVPIRVDGPRHSPLSLARVARTIGQYEADIIHTHATKATSMFRTVRPFFLRGPLHVATVHGMKRSVNAYESADAVICVSQRVSRTIRRAAKRVIYNGIEPNGLPTDADRASARLALGVPEGRPLLMTVGRLASVKGLDVLIEAMVNVEATLAIVGDGPELRCLQEQAARLGVDDRVIFTGFRDDVPCLLPGADLAVISSRREGFPYVLVEMLQNRLPVLTTDVGDMRELLGDAMVVPTQDPAALRERLQRALEDLSGLKEKFAPHFDRARREFTCTQMAEQTLELYEQVLAKRPHRPYQTREDDPTRRDRRSAGYPLGSAAAGASGGSS